MNLLRRRALISLAVWGAFAATAWGQAPPPPPRRPVRLPTPAEAIANAHQPASTVFRNLKVLKTIPAGELIPTMQYITVALGVRCTFCHVEGAFYKDTKRPKRTARRMMRMLLAIDGRNFHGNPVVTCYTCHRGRHSPVGIPPLAGIALPGAGAPGAAPPPAGMPPASRARTGRPPRVSAAGLPSPVEIQARYLRALGGASALAAIHSLVESGALSSGRGPQFSIRIERRAPGLARTVITTPRGSFANGFDGQNAWEQLGPRLEILVGAQRQTAIAESALFPALALARDYTRLRVGLAALDGRPAYRVFALRRGGFAIFFFDRQSGLLRRRILFTRNPLGVLSEATDFGDYRLVSGVKIPYRIRVHQPQGVQTITLRQVSANVPLPRADFAPPATRAQLTR